MATSAFVSAMDNDATTKSNHLQRGENGTAEFTARGVEESRVAFFFALVRDIPQERLKDLFSQVINDANEEHPEVVADIFLLAFQTRNCRGGKGERDLFYKIIMELAVMYPLTVESLMKLVPRYGSFKDWFKLVSLATAEATDPKVKAVMVPIANTIMDLATEQLLQDQKALLSANNTHSVSLLAKWAPREKKQFQKQVGVLANKLFPSSNSPKKDYRQLLSKLNKSLRTVEVAMSANEWQMIDPSCIPSVSLMKQRKALLNENVKGAPPDPHGDENMTGNRHPTNPDRINCRKRLRDAMVDKKASKLKGKQLFPHEIVSKIGGEFGYFGYRVNLSTMEKDIFECQWKDIRENLQKSMNEAKVAVAVAADVDSINDDGSEDRTPPSEPKRKVNLGNIVPIVDVSGSMDGVPMDVAVALGILISEINSPTFANRCLTFDSNPSWFEFDPRHSLCEKVEAIRQAPWGMTTDFEKAMEKILGVSARAKLKPDEIPNLIVFSDMQFDQARRSVQNYDKVADCWETHHERIVRRFKQTGLQVCGEEWPAPHIVFWNLRGDTAGFPVQGDTPNVTMLSGYSPSLMKLLLSGEALEEDEEEESVEVGVNGEIVKTVRGKKNPYDTVRKALDDVDYNKVRNILCQSEEGLLKFYTAPVDAIANTDDVVVQQAKEEMGRDVVDTSWEMVV